MMLFNYASQTQPSPSSSSDSSPSTELDSSSVRDQADGLRQLRRIDDPHLAEANGKYSSEQYASEQFNHEQQSGEELPSQASPLEETPVKSFSHFHRAEDKHSDIRTNVRINVPPQAESAFSAGLLNSGIGQARVLPWPRVVIVSEFPSTDVGARFAWHLVQSLSVGTTSSAQNLLVDLSPAASRLPHVLADCVPSTSYAPLWSQLASGRPLSVQPARLTNSLAVAAEPQAHPCPLDQLPRVYEQLVRQLSRHAERWRWIVLLAMDSVVPLDRACWQAADDVILLHGAESTGCQRQAAALRNRIEEDDPRRSIWTLPKRRAGWRSILERSLLRGLHSGFHGSHRHSLGDLALSTRWLEAGIATQLLPAVAWPEPTYGVASEQQLREGSRVDRALRKSARAVADALRLSAACQSSSGVLSFDGAQKKIQLGPHLRPIRQSTDEFRA